MLADARDGIGLDLGGTVSTSRLRQQSGNRFLGFESCAGPTTVDADS